MHSKITAFVSMIQRPFTAPRPSISHKTKTSRALHQSSIGLVCLGLTLASGPSSAQSQQASQQQIFKNHFKNWYQVEVVIFERGQQESSDAESWPKNVPLAYPARLQFLGASDGDRDAAPETSLNAAQTPDSGGVSDVPVKNDVHEQFRRQLEQPFVPLDKQLRTMNGEARRLQRSSSMRVLFHETWRQPIVDKNNATAIVMNAGDTFGENSELEGSITLHVSRYLHINTNLWMTQFEANFGQESEHWPILPRQPTLANFYASDISELARADTRDGDAISTEGADSAVTDDNVADIRGDNNWDISFNKNTTLASNDRLTRDLLGDYGSITQKPYVVKHLVTMKQKRRMRSGELHYLDHPRLGLLIRIDKYKPSMPQNITDSQGL